VGFFVYVNIYKIKTMKRLLNEEEERKIKQMHSLNEDMVSDLVDKIKSSDTVQNIKKKFEDLLGIKLGDDDKKEEGSEDEEDSTIKVTDPSSKDQEFYEKVLKGIGAPVTKSNLKFMYAWRQGEGAKARFNPFNTTKSKPDASFYNCLKKDGEKCVSGVRNYESEDEGIKATVETLNLDYYDCITDGLKNDIGAKKIARKCKSALKTWGTGELVAKVLDGGNLKPPTISTSETKTVA